MIMIISKPITWRQQTTLYDDNDGQTMTSPRVLGLSWEAHAGSLRVIHLSQDVFSKHQWPNRGHHKEGTSKVWTIWTIDNGHQELILLSSDNESWNWRVNRILSAHWRSNIDKSIFMGDPRDVDDDFKVVFKLWSAGHLSEEHLKVVFKYVLKQSSNLIVCCELRLTILY